MADTLPPDLLDRQALIGGLVFTASRLDLLPYPRKSVVWGTYEALGTEMAVPLSVYSTALKGSAMREFLADHWRAMHNLGVGSTYIPVRKNRRDGPALYKITELLGTDHMRVSGGKVMTASMFNTWRARTSTRAKRN